MRLRPKRKVKPVCKLRAARACAIRIAGLCCTAALTLHHASANSEGTVRPIEFNRDIRPILSDNCFQCHGPDRGTRKAGLRLDVRAEAVAERRGVRAVAPGDSASSEMIARILSDNPEHRMPPLGSERSVTAEEAEILKRWIAQGAAYEPHWAYIKPKEAAPPAVLNAGWPIRPLDRFVLARLEAEGLAPSPEADRVTLIRRLHFDLTGLPPTPSEVAAFAEDPAPDAYERLVERLLASPHYGERMAIHWLDLVRYADTVGYHGDQERGASGYRDYVITAFNANMPFDRFTREQLAGDLLEHPTREQRLASGFNRLNMVTREGGAQPKDYLERYAADRVRTTATAWLGSSLACAQCHDHKFDPFTIEDFYRFGAFFADIKEDGVQSLGGNEAPFPPYMLFPTKEQESKLREFEERLSRLTPGPEATEEEAARLHKEAEKVSNEKLLFEGSILHSVVTESGEPRVMRVLARGNWMDESGPAAEPAVPAFLGGMWTTGARPTRLDLAAWLTDPNNPLTARVFVNRLWKRYFGTGISKVLDDFGSQGEWPTHPELLDYLAIEFVRSGWDMKHMVREMVTSAAYRQSSMADEGLKARDPFNRLFARQSRIRLEAELVRDNALKVSGLLSPKIGGRSVMPYQPPKYYRELNFPEREYQQDSGENLYRRGVYTHWQRTFLHPSLVAFDAPTREECTAERVESNSPQQALTLLNDPAFVEAARVFAQRIIAEGGESADERIAWAYREALSRAPSAAEAEIVSRLFERHHAAFAADPASADAFLEVGAWPVPPGIDRPLLAAWSSVGRALFNLHEMIHRY